MEYQELVQEITKKVLERLQMSSYSSSNGTSKGETEQSLTPADLAAYIDHTLLRPDATEDEVLALCRDAKQYRFYSVCVNSCWVELCARELRNTGVKVCSVVGFPLGAIDSRTKGAETRNAIENGADEIDMVINIGALKSKKFDYVENDIRWVLRSCRQKTVTKVIIETALLNSDEKVLACEIAKKVKADFVKTSTGFAKGGATVEDVSLMRKVVGPTMGVKASGGVRTFETAAAMIRAGATRIGTSSSVALIQGGV